MKSLKKARRQIERVKEGRMKRKKELVACAPLITVDRETEERREKRRGVIF